MSSIGSVGITNSNVQQFSNVGRSGQCGSMSDMKLKFEQAVKDAGGSNIDFDKLESQIHSAIQDVLKTADSTDPQQVGEKVQQAIDATLKQNGIDPEKVKSEMQAFTGAEGPGSAAPGRLPTGGTPSSNSILQSLAQCETSSSSSDQSTSVNQSADELLQQLIKRIIQNLPTGSAVDAAA